MKILSITLFAVSASVTATSFAACPSQLSADDMHECIMMEGNDDLGYREWAPEFYKNINPQKSASVRAAYEAETKHTKKKEKGGMLSLSQ